MCIVFRPDQERLSRLGAFLHQHAFEHVTLRQISRELGMSVSTVQRYLRHAHGVGFHETLERMRVMRALAIVEEEPGLKVDALARAVGWRGRKSLYRATLRIVGRPLSDLRKEAAARSRADAQVEPRIA